jgi:hypothetical protein
MAKKKPADKKTAAPKKDMTWGGRPDPTPEIYVSEEPGPLAKLFGKKSKK